MQLVYFGDGGKYGGGGWNLATPGVDGSSFADGFTIRGQTIAASPSPFPSIWRRIGIDATAVNGVTAVLLLHRNAPGVTSFPGVGGRPLHVVNPIFSAKLN